MTPPTAEQVILVTGASSGVGRGVDRAFDARRAKVALVARNVDALAIAADEIRRMGGDALVVPADVADADAVERAGAAVEERWGRIDTWVNVAMVSGAGAGKGHHGRGVAFWTTPIPPMAWSRTRRQRAHQPVSRSSALRWRRIRSGSNEGSGRAAAIERALATLRFSGRVRGDLRRMRPGYQGFYYHFLDRKTERRVWNAELSTSDTTFLLAGALTVAAYFHRETDDEAQIERLPTRSNGGPIGGGHRTAGRRSRTDGRLRAAF